MRRDNGLTLSIEGEEVLSQAMETFSEACFGKAVPLRAGVNFVPIVYLGHSDPWG